MRTFDNIVVDADVLCYRVGFATQKNIYTLELAGECNGEIYTGSDKRLVNRITAGLLLSDFHLSEMLRVEPLLSALLTVDKILAGYKELFQAENVTLLLTGSGNYRDDIAITKPYKGTRTQEKPVHHAAIKKHLIEKHGAVVIEGAEADDELSMAMWRDQENTVGITIDKDAKNTPGWLYNPNKDELLNVTTESARKHFWTQVLTGDSVDNIPGCPGIGPAKAAKILDGCTTDESFYKVCLIRGYDGNAIMLEEQARLLWMSRESYNDWRKPE